MAFLECKFQSENAHRTAGNRKGLHVRLDQSCSCCSTCTVGEEGAHRWLPHTLHLVLHQSCSFPTRLYQRIFPQCLGEHPPCYWSSSYCGSAGIPLTPQPSACPLGMATSPAPTASQSTRCSCLIAVKADQALEGYSSPLLPSVFARNLQCQPVRKLTPERNVIAHAHGSASRGANA
jgi:hypothetical protein